MLTLILLPLAILYGAIITYKYVKARKDSQLHSGMLSFVLRTILNAAEKQIAKEQTEDTEDSW